MHSGTRQILIIDGYNLIHAAPDVFRKMPELEGQRNHLVNILNSTPSLSYDKIIVVFDGQKSEFRSKKERRNNVQVLYSASNQEADDVIQQLIRKESHKSFLVIVSSDRKIMNAAKDHVSKIISSQEFWKSIHKKTSGSRKKGEAPAESGRQLSEKEVREWLEIFRNRSTKNDNS